MDKSKKAILGVALLTVLLLIAQLFRYLKDEK